ncbi:hypothetical protein DENSPDRAFT_347245 [Dentipellis sp. KUC8613]|nr:hypothetical protein DENSPDRAFT_347245 [Dentipellis sp. KUC8613]
MRILSMQQLANALASTPGHAVVWSPRFAVKLVCKSDAPNLNAKCRCSAQWLAIVRISCGTYSCQRSSEGRMRCWQRARTTNGFTSTCAPTLYDVPTPPA